jgi:hypothetical protein
MEDRVKQTEAFVKMCDLVSVPHSERPQIMQGVDIFFDRGWPSNYFTVGMARSAGAGLIPDVYEGLHSKSEYLARMESETKTEA